ncbi:unnamed protein product, partial [Owenia fusiformis]
MYHILERWINSDTLTVQTALNDKFRFEPDIEKVLSYAPWVHSESAEMEDIRVKLATELINEQGICKASKMYEKISMKPARISAHFRALHGKVCEHITITVYMLVYILGKYDII